MNTIRFIRSNHVIARVGWRLLRTSPRERRCVAMRHGVALAMLLAAFPAGAWSGAGHRAVAELVWRQMDAAQRHACADMLRHHPHYQELLQADRPPTMDAGHWAFLSAAAWPDWVRPAKTGQPPKPESVTKYNAFPHGVELPFARPGDGTAELLKQYPDVKPTARVALEDSIATVHDPRASAHDRAVSLSWVLHLLADLHQPLHCANLVTKERLRDLSAGGKFLVRNEDGQSVTLHAFWDRLAGEDGSQRALMTLADKLACAPELQPAALPEYQTNRTAAAWVRESHQLAVDFAYAANRVEFVSTDAVDAGPIPAQAIPAVTAEYAAEARKIAHRRLALAAWRLLDVLKFTGHASPANDKLAPPRDSP